MNIKDKPIKFTNLEWGKFPSKSGFYYLEMTRQYTYWYLPFNKYKPWNSVGKYKFPSQVEFNFKSNKEMRTFFIKRLNEYRLRKAIKL